MRSFNAMSAELKATEEKRKDLLRDLAHEIRTPLTILSGNLEALTLDSSSPDLELSPRCPRRFLA